MRSSDERNAQSTCGGNNQSPALGTRPYWPHAVTRLAVTISATRSSCCSPVLGLSGKARPIGRSINCSASVGNGEKGFWYIVTRKLSPWIEVSLAGVLNYGRAIAAGGYPICQVTNRREIRIPMEFRPELQHPCAMQDRLAGARNAAPEHCACGRQRQDWRQGE